MFSADGSFSETTNLGNRGSSLGNWTHTAGSGYNATYWFFRYKPDETPSSFAKAVDTITLAPNGNQFTSAGTVQDFDANGVLLSTGCFLGTANRLPGPPNSPRPPRDSN